jgi:hypothetical protein
MVYFSSYIPFFAWIVNPLFKLLKKGVKWEWGELEQEAYELSKRVLQSSPILAYAQPGKGYRLYTDASDYGVAGILQQIQAIAARDLKGTKAYARLQKAYRAGQPVPALVSTVPSKKEAPLPKRSWAENFDDTIVDIERVVAYWSRVLKAAEKNYSPTEKEALALKEALVKFQPYLEGEVILAITDHKALIWGRTFQNVNRRLLTWGTVYAAYPDLEVVHREGRVHSNVDPISRLKRRIPFYEAPLADSAKHIELGLSSDLTQEKDWQERLFSRLDSKPPKTKHERDSPLPNLPLPIATTAVAETRATRSKRKKNIRAKTTRPTSKEPIKAKTTRSRPAAETVRKSKQAKHAKDQTSIKEFAPSTVDATTSPPYSIDVIRADKDLVTKYRKAYENDSTYRDVLKHLRDNEGQLNPKYRHYQLRTDGLIYFVDRSDRLRLCVPQFLRNHVLTTTHEELKEAAHAGYERTYNRLTSTYYWSGMLRDVKKFVKTCDTCQKIKHRRHAPYGLLQPIPIPDKPFDVVSMDLITDLPESDGYNAILVIVDKLTKYGLFIPTTTRTTEVDTARMFVQHIIAQYGVPKAVISDRDTRWRGEFWKEVSSAMGFERNLTTAYHPQADGQTEILNQSLEVSLRAYVNDIRDNWSSLLPEYSMSYNTTVHTATTYSPAYLLYGYEPNRLATFLLPQGPSQDRSGFLRDNSISFLESLQTARSRARDALIIAQNTFQNAYNQNRINKEFEVGDSVLINPHSLRLEGPWGGKGRKLAERYEGPFEVIEKYGPVTYRIRLPPDYDIHPVLHISHLEPYHASPEDLGPREKRGIKTRGETNKIDWVVTAILEEKLSEKVQGRRHILYRCRWLYPDGIERETDEWIPHYDMNNAPDVLREWRKKVRANPKLKAR